MSSTQFWTGMLVPPLIKWLNPIIKKWFNLPEFDPQTRVRITTRQYPSYYFFLYGLWILALLGSGFAVALFFITNGQQIFPSKSFAIPVFIGLINMVGAFFILGAILDWFFWRISSEKFKDYVLAQQLRSGWRYDIKQQASILFKIGIIYYVITTPIMVTVYLFVR